MSRRPWVGVAVVAVVASAACWLGGSTESAEAAADTLLDEVASGWHDVPCPRAAGPAKVRCFATEDGGASLMIAAFGVPEWSDPRAFVTALTAASGAGSSLFTTPRLDAARGFASSDDTAALESVDLAVAAREQVFLITYIGATGSVADPVDLVTDVGRRQQSLAGGAPPRNARATPAEAQLDRLFVHPPAGFTAVTVRVRSDLESLRAVARSQRVVDVLERDNVTRTRAFVGNGMQVVVVLDRMPYDEFAAAGLGAAAGLRERVHLRGLEPVPDAYAVDASGTGVHGVTILFRRGPYLVTVGAAGAVGADGVDPRVLDETAARFAAAQQARLPEGATEPYYFPSTTGAVIEVILFTTSVCLLVVAFGRIRAGRRRLRVRRGGADEPAHLDHVDDVSRDGGRLRREGRTIVLAQLVAVNLMVVGLLGVLDVLRWPPGWASAILLVVGLVGGVAFTRWRRRRELDAIGPASTSRGATLPSPAGIAAGAVAVALLVAGLALLTTGFAGIAFGPGLSTLEWADTVGLSPNQLSIALAAAGVVLVAGGGVLFRLARMWARAGARRLRQHDHRPAILYLRSFEDDALPIATVLSARRPFFELFRLGGTDPFEEAVAWELVPYGPVVAVGRPGRSLASLGAAREYLPDDQWREDVAARMAASRAIIMTIGETDGLRWELEQVASARHIDRTIFVFPPVDGSTLRDRWHFTSQALGLAGVAPPVLPDDAASIFTAVFDPPGPWWVTIADVRDEATYRAAIDRSMEWLTVRPTPTKVT